jgi:hypothetical protein
MGEEALAEVCPLAGGERTVPITVVIVVVVVVVVVVFIRIPENFNTDTRKR